MLAWAVVVATLALQGLAGEQHLKCDGVKVATGGSGASASMIFAIGPNSIRVWDDDKQTWSANKCNDGAKCYFTPSRYGADEKYETPKGLNVSYSLVINRETGEAKETYLSSGPSTMFSGKCNVTEDPAVRRPITKF